MGHVVMMMNRSLTKPTKILELALFPPFLDPGLCWDLFLEVYHNEAERAFTDLKVSRRIPRTLPAKTLIW